MPNDTTTPRVPGEEPTRRCAEELAEVLRDLDDADPAAAALIRRTIDDLLAHHRGNGDGLVFCPMCELRLPYDHWLEHKAECVR